MQRNSLVHPLMYTINLLVLFQVHLYLGQTQKHMMVVNISFDYDA